VDGVSGVSALAAGDAHTCALRTDETVWCWGRGSSGQTAAAGAPEVAPPTQVLLGGSPLTGVAGLSAGGGSTCAVLGDGAVFCWGDNAAGQLGIGAAGGDTCGPTSMPLCAHAPRRMANVSDAATVSTGVDVTCVVRRNRAALCTGDGGSGKLGTGSEASSDVPVPVQAVPGLTGFTSVRVGARHVCGQASISNALWCWGSNDKGQLFEDPVSVPQRLSPTLVGPVTGVAQIVIGVGATCALSGGSVVCAGDNGAGQLGAGPGPDGFAHPSPARVGGLP
jgi:alpha-tubulin suppressor-like RCC1 family protein